VTSRNETVLPVARRVDAGASAVVVGARPRLERGRHRQRPDLAAAAPAGPRRRRWLFALLLVAGWLVQAGLRGWLSRTQAVPLDNPDETAYLVAARFLAGGPAADFSGGTLYRGGYPLLITPVYWFTSSPSAVYHAALLVNAAVSAAVLPLGYLACRRLGLGRPAAYGVAMIAALLPAAFFYSEYAIADAIFPVVTLAWLLTTHSWLVATSARMRYAAATGSAVLSGYAWAVHSRGSVMLAGFAAICVFIAWRRPAARGSVAAGVLAAVLTAGAASVMDRYLVAGLYPEGTRSLSGQLVSTLESFYGIVHVTEMAAGQLWRLVLDSWGIAGIGLVASVGAIARRGVRTDLRVMAALSVGVTIGIAFAAPAALPPQQTLVWASGRYLDGMIVTFFLVGAVVLLRAATRTILACAAWVAGLAVMAALTVAVYAGTSLPTGRGMRFDFGEPAVLTQNWSHASVLVATAAALALLGAWVVFALLARDVQVLTCLLGAAVALVSLAAVVQLTAYGPRADTARADRTGVAALAAANRLEPGEQVAIATNLSGILRIAQGFEVSSAKLDVFNPFCAPPPADVTVIDAAWPAGQPARASLPEAPAGWQVVAANRLGGWVLWRKSPGAAAMRVNTALCRHPLATPALTGR
jgi:hypothetical protein